VLTEPDCTVISGALPENKVSPKKFIEQADDDEQIMPFDVSIPPVVKSTSNPPFSLDGKKIRPEGAMLTGTPFNAYVKLLISVTSISDVPLSAVAGTGFDIVSENDHASPGALQLLVGALLPQTPEPEIVAESALALTAPTAIIPSTSATRQRYLRMVVTL
jgi:hypothetical protein